MQETSGFEPPQGAIALLLTALICAACSGPSVDAGDLRRPALPLEADPAPIERACVEGGFVEATEASQYVTREHPAARHTVYVEGSGGACTGALIGPRTVLTAWHCVRERWATVVIGRGLLEAPVTFYVSGNAISLHPRVAHRPDIDLFTNDVALVHLPDDPPEGWEAAPFGPDVSVERGQELLFAGYGRVPGCRLYPCNRDGRQLRVFSSHAVAFDDGLERTIRYRSGEGRRPGTCFGDSGGPVFTCRGDGRLVLVGVSWGTDTTDPEETCQGWGLVGDVRDFVDFIDRYRLDLSD